MDELELEREEIEAYDRFCELEKLSDGDYDFNYDILDVLCDDTYFGED